MTKRKRWDKNRPETKALVDEIVHGTFVKEGTMVAFPTCFPGASVPITADESHITALDVTPEGIVYGGTSGKKLHFFVAMFHGVTGAVFDLGALNGPGSCRTISCGEKEFIASINGSEGGALVIGKLQPLPFDLIQEWGFSRPDLEVFPMPGRLSIVDAAMYPLRKSLAVVTTDSIFSFGLDERRIDLVTKGVFQGRVVVGPSGKLIGANDEALWRFDPNADRFESQWLELPDGKWKGGVGSWAKDNTRGLLYLSDSDGSLFSLNEDGERIVRVGRLKVGPIGPMAVTADGRLFGTRGKGVSRIFCYDPRDGSLRDLGVAASVIERRRYGYEFGAAVVGRDGEVIFGEDDDLGHLWLYFPRVLP